MRKIKILEAKIIDAKMDFEFPNKISLSMYMIADSVINVRKSEKCGMKIMELRDSFKKIKITIEDCSL